ncbi:protein phosphatase 1 regulatory subunit 14A [Sus scrofa]|uniref:Protein phosphatase 1 regulatory subunit 14A n=3 Tax=Sus scrofa TaxID=9823 RepID=PP14A_PIG|nr:protein phosphatase 1 regulatory subunit 14A [Sus scrofa]O18734.1 RecName: Full=Protein phosphatase 1 regulatory subunit 14A; AltName: Full=17 kDa PKC-potentiated inhibitory protein of PP1; AltName: Full=Protein kinase C-potentiated inhibitor protein of 17 kDa; Short=CPI-17 [Sus scrofa]BAA22995.1 17-kDa PKC-potentiated inhibitory protein of PP1 [Sus scrofa]
MAAQRLGKRVLSKLQSPSRARGPGGSPGGLQKRHARVTVKYDRRELQRRLDVEKWIDGRLEELYRGREADMPDEVNIDELLELESEEERSRKIQGLLKSCTNPTENFVQELLVKLRGLHKQPGLRQPSPSGDGSLSPRQDRARTAPP